MKIYYSHSLRKYNTPQEQAEIDTILAHFPESELVNPNTQAYRTKWARLPEREVMRICLKLVKESDCLVFSEYAGWISKGVYMECVMAYQTKKQIYLLRSGNFYAGGQLMFKKIGRNWAVQYATVTIREKSE